MECPSGRDEFLSNCVPVCRDCAAGALGSHWRGGIWCVCPSARCASLCFVIDARVSDFFIDFHTDLVAVPIRLILSASLFTPSRVKHCYSCTDRRGGSISHKMADRPMESKLKRFEAPHPWRQGDRGWRQTRMAVADAVTTALSPDGRQYCLLVVSGQGPATGKTLSTNSVLERLRERWSMTPNMSHMSPAFAWSQDWSDRDIELRILDRYGTKGVTSIKGGWVSAAGPEPLKKLLILEVDQLPPNELKNVWEHMGITDESSVTIVRLDIV